MRATDSSGLSTYGLNGLGKGDEHATYASYEYGPRLPLPLPHEGAPHIGIGQLQQSDDTVPSTSSKGESKKPIKCYECRMKWLYVVGTCSVSHH